LLSVFIQFGFSKQAARGYAQPLSALFSPRAAWLGIERKPLISKPFYSSLAAFLRPALEIRGNALIISTRWVRVPITAPCPAIYPATF
jgi:hypothetical protein